MTISGMNRSSSWSAPYAQWRLSLQRTSTPAVSKATESASEVIEGKDGQAGDGDLTAKLHDASTPSASSAPGGLTDAYAAELGVRLQARNAQLFKQLDSDGNGILSAQEIIAGKEAIHNARAALIGEQINQANPELFKALDTDGDGRLDGKELDAGKALLADGGQAAPKHLPHRRYPDEEQAAQVEISSLMAQLDVSSAAGTSADAANLRSNSLADILRNLFSGPSAPATV